MVWEGIKAQGCMSCPHNVWDHPYFHQQLSCSVIIVIHHSHQWNICRISLEISWNVIRLKIPPPMPLSTDVARWVVNGANVEIPSTCASMRQNLTWLDKTHACMVWDGFKAQVCTLFTHNVWYLPHFSSTFIMQFHWNHSPFPSTKSLLKLSWNVMERLPTSPSMMPLSIDVTHWVVKEANFEIPSTCTYMCWNLTWLDKAHAFTLWEGFKD